MHLHFFLRVTKKQLLIFVEGLNAEHCSLLALILGEH